MRAHSHSEPSGSTTGRILCAAPRQSWTNSFSPEDIHTCRNEGSKPPTPDHRSCALAAPKSRSTGNNENGHNRRNVGARSDLSEEDAVSLWRGGPVGGRRTYLLDCTSSNGTDVWRARRMNNVLVASDLTARSEVACRRAILMAEQAGASIHLVHVLEERIPAQQTEAEEQLRTLASSVPETLRIECDVRVGEPHAEIVTAASECAADLIVMGSHEKRLSRIFVGTTVERVMRTGGRPVLMVNVEPSLPYEHVLLPVDMSVVSANAIQAARSLGLLAQGKALFFHAFIAPAKTHLHFANVEPGKIDEHVSASRREAFRELAEFLRPLGEMPPDYDLILEEGPPFLGIKKIAERIKLDLIVVGTHGRSGIKRALIGSVADEVLRRAECDVLAVPPAENV